MLIIAHRGASGDAPENTMAAFNLAWRQNADGIELDVHLSRDGRVMVHHDPSTGRLADADLIIANSDCDALQKLDLGRWKGPEFAGERMPVLEQVLAGVPPGKRVIIEIKCGPKIVPALVRLLEAPAFRMLDVTLISFDLDVLAACHNQLPTVPCFFIEEADSSNPKPYSEHLIQLALEQGFAGLDLDYKGLTKAFAQRVRQAGLRLLTWTVNDASYSSHLLACGVEGVTTDWPLRFLTIGEHS